MPDPTMPEIPGEKWHKETYEESLKPKQKPKPTIVVPDDTRDDSGWVSQDDDTGLAN